jgi:uncharacterized protein
MIWTQTRYGKAFDLLNPDPALVDFDEIALTLAHLNRYAGNFEKAISVGQHTLIACDAADEADKPHVLIHDAHEAFIGDIPTPAAQALAAYAQRRGGEGWGVIVSNAIAHLKHDLDVSIHAAAGLSVPAPALRQRIRAADLRALQTERRDFLAKCLRSWAPEVEAHAPLTKVYRMRPAAIVAEELQARFKRYLPALNKRAA